jgi:30S ribosomal protein S31
MNRQPFKFVKLIHLKFIFMGRGDKKTKRGKISKGSFGKSRPAKPGKNKKAKTEKPE